MISSLGVGIVTLQAPPDKYCYRCNALVWTPCAVSLYATTKKGDLCIPCAQDVLDKAKEIIDNE